jgi:hypothetical protein
MHLHVQTAQAGSLRQRGEGLRIGAVRFLVLIELIRGAK